MNHFFKRSVQAICSLTLFVGGMHSVVAQKAKPRVFAPGVETIIKPDVRADETLSVHDIIEIQAQKNLNWKPHYLPASRTLAAITKEARFTHEIWGLEFSFKPLRMMHVDVPNKEGKIERKLIWYMVYRVKNKGDRLHLVESSEGTSEVTKAPSKPIKFMPQFVLESHDRTATGKSVFKAYLDTLVPTAIEPIRRRETPNRKLLTTIEMTDTLIKLSEKNTDRSVWGLVMWENVDPRIDFFSVNIAGLTNAYKWIDPKGAYKLGDQPGTGRRFYRKTLQLNFWRPGDGHLQHESEVRYGVPAGKAYLYGVKEGVASRWTYR